MARSLSRKTVAKAINKCKSRSAKLLHKKAKTPAQRRKVLAKAAKRCTKKKVLARRKRNLARRKNKKNVQEDDIPQPVPVPIPQPDPVPIPQPDPVPIPQPVPIEEEEELGIYPAEFIVRHLYPQSYEKPGFDTMIKEPIRLESLDRIAAMMVARYSDCEECMITLMTIENEETGQKTFYDFLSTPPPRPDEGRYFVDIYLDDIPMQLMNRFGEMKEEVREADCTKVDDIAEETQQEILKHISRQNIPFKLLGPLYESVVEAEDARKEECATLMPDVEFQGRVKKSDGDKIMGAFRKISDVECDRDKIDAAFNQAENTLSNIGMFDTDPEGAMKIYKQLEKAKGVKEERCFEE